MTALFSAAERGVKVRIQLDSGLGTEEGNFIGRGKRLRCGTGEPLGPGMPADR